MLALFAVGDRNWHSSALQVSSVLEEVAFVCPNAGTRWVLPSHSHLFFKLFFLLPSQTDFPIWTNLVQAHTLDICVDTFLQQEQIFQ